MVREIPQVGSATPWGVAQHVDVLIPGEFVFASTASHGGYWLSRRLVMALPKVCRETPYSHGGWFEEDVDAAIPVAFVAECAAVCSPGGVEAARATIRGYFPSYLPDVAKALAAREGA